MEAGAQWSRWRVAQPRPQGLLSIQNGGLEKTLANSRSRDLKLASLKAHCRFEMFNQKLSPIFLETHDLLFARVFSELISEPPF